jgi:hypothetical protein
VAALRRAAMPAALAAAAWPAVAQEQGAAVAPVPAEPARKPTVAAASMGAVPAWR